MHPITNRVSRQGRAIASIQPSVYLFVSVLTFEPTYMPFIQPGLMCVYGSRGIESKSHESNLKVEVRVEY